MSDSSISVNIECLKHGRQLFKPENSTRETAPLPPKNHRGHRFEAQFRDEMEKHINEHINMFKSWTIVDKSEAKSHQILGCQWVFTYKTDKHNRITKCRARLVVCGNQRRECDLPTRATTLATTSLRTLLAIVAKINTNCTLFPTRFFNEAVRQTADGCAKTQTVIDGRRKTQTADRRRKT